LSILKSSFLLLSKAVSTLDSRETRVYGLNYLSVPYWKNETGIITKTKEGSEQISNEKERMNVESNCSKEFTGNF